MATADHKTPQGRGSRDPIPRGHNALPPGKSAKRLYSIKEAAEYLALSTWTVRELIWKGELPHVRLGRRILLDLQDLEALIVHHKIRGP